MSTVKSTTPAQHLRLKFNSMSIAIRTLQSSNCQARHAFDYTKMAQLTPVNPGQCSQQTLNFRNDYPKLVLLRLNVGSLRQASGVLTTGSSSLFIFS